MASKRLLRSRRSQEYKVALRDVYQSVEDGGFGAVEAGSTEGGDNEGAEEGAVEGLRL